MLLKTKSGTNIKPLFLAFVLVAANPLATTGADISELEKITNRRGKLRVAVDAAVGIR